MAADEDIVRFAAEIHKNSNRLLTLINDIIRLSELDQVEEHNCFEELDIYDIAQNCVEMLRLSARKTMLPWNYTVYTALSVPTAR